MPRNVRVAVSLAVLHLSACCIRGTVTNQGTGTALQGATIHLSGRQTGATTTDVNGRYSFSNPPVGNYTVTPSMQGYTFTPQHADINISAWGKFTADFTASRIDPGFTLAATPNPVSVPQGGTASLTLAVSRVGGFSGDVSVTFTGLPSGVSATPATLVIPAANASASVTLTAAATAPAGAYATQANGAAGALSAAAPFQIQVTTPGFTLSVTPNPLAVSVSGSANLTIGVTRFGGFTGSVAISFSALPTGVTAAPATTTITGNSTTVALAAAATSAPGTYTAQVSGSAGSLAANAAFGIAVKAPCFTVAATPDPVRVTVGRSATLTVKVDRCGGFTGPLSMTFGGLPAGVTATPATLTLTGASASVTLAAAASATPGQASVTIAGSIGSYTQQAVVTLEIDPAITAGSFINQNDFIWSQSSTSVGGKTITMSSSGITVTGPTGQVFYAFGGSRVGAYKFIGTGNYLLLLQRDPGPGPIVVFVSLVDFGTTPPTIRPLFMINSDTSRDLPHVDYSQGNGAAFLIYAFDSAGQQLQTAIYRSTDASILCAGPPPFLPTGQTLAQASSTQLVINYNQSSSSLQIACPLP